MLVAVAMAASLHSYWIYHTPMEPDIRIGSTLLFVVVNGCFAAAAWLNATSAVERFDKRMGDLTYALYLCHMPLICLIVTLSLSPPIESALVTAASLFVAWIIFYCVERAMFRLRDRFRGRRLCA